MPFGSGTPRSSKAVARLPLAVTGPDTSADVVPYPIVTEVPEILGVLARADAAVIPDTVDTAGYDHAQHSYLVLQLP